MKTLIVHHLESIWENAYQQHRHSFEGLCEKLFEFLQENHFDKVILTRFEQTDLEDMHLMYGLGEYIFNVHDYGYGWTEESVEHLEDDDWCEGGHHSEIVMIDELMKELRGEISICGAFDGECIDDLETALNHLNINFKRIEELII